MFISVAIALIPNAKIINKLNHKESVSDFFSGKRELVNKIQKR